MAMEKQGVIDENTPPEPKPAPKPVPVRDVTSGVTVKPPVAMKEAADAAEAHATARTADAVKEASRGPGKGFRRPGPSKA